MRALKSILAIAALAASATLSTTSSARADVPPPSDSVTYSWKAAAISGTDCTARVGKAVTSSTVYLAARVNCRSHENYYSVTMHPQRGSTTLGTRFKRCGDGFGCIIRRAYTNPRGSQTWYLSMKGCARSESWCNAGTPRWTFTA